MSESSLDLEARVAALESARAAKWPRRHLSRKRVGILLLAVVLAAPTAVLASHLFTDVPTTNTFHNQISILAAAGITKGCNPPSNTLYCPADPVRRDQMAAFLIRAAGRMSQTGFFFPASTGGSAFATITIKTEGTAWVDARGALYTIVSENAASTYPCENAVVMSIDGSTIGTYAGDNSWQSVNVSPASGWYDAESHALEVGVVVNAGTHTVSLVRYNGTFGGTCAFGIGRGTLTAEVVPFSGTGSTPVQPTSVGPSKGSKASGQR